jgi:DNA end-binding protein Ku
MAETASWKGYLKLSLVTCAIAVYPTTTVTTRVTFQQLNRATGNRLKQQMVDAETGEPVERDEIVRGYPVGKDEYVRIEDEELDALALESTRTIDIERFVVVPHTHIDGVNLLTRQPGQPRPQGGRVRRRRVAHAGLSEIEKRAGPAS